MKLYRLFIVVLLGMLVIPTLATAGDFDEPVITCGAGPYEDVYFDIVYDGKTYDPDTDRSTFCYTVSGNNTPPDLSHVVLGIPACEPGINVLSGTPEEGIQLPPSMDPTTGVFGVKWDSEQATDQTIQYCYTVDGNLVEGVVQYGMKAATCTKVGQIQGPTCVDVCDLDSDDDGVSDCEDQCEGADDGMLGQSCEAEGDVCGEAIYVCGEQGDLVCEFSGPTDSDNDGIPDCQDQCEGADDSMLGQSCEAEGDVCGEAYYVCGNNDGPEVLGGNGGSGYLYCQFDGPTDSDGDQVPDCLDQCEGANDSMLGQPCQVEGDVCGEAVYICGGNVPTVAGKGGYGYLFCYFEGPTDSDGDGTPDCLDECPNDPNKTVPGVCGCGESDEDTNGNGIPDCLDINDDCPDGEECIFEALLPSGCTYANGFFEHINIASVINLRNDLPLTVTVSYRDLLGVLKGSVTTEIGAGLKRDFIVNELGLEPDSYGTVCVDTNATEDGEWTGANVVYKPNLRLGAPGGFGTGLFDYANYYIFSNPRTGAFTHPVNTYHLGVDPVSTVANWFSLADAVPGDGIGLRGVVQYIDEQGNIVNVDQVNLTDGGRFDFDAHRGLAGDANPDRVGLARFIPENNDQKYLIAMQRYYYDCVGASCPHHHTAFVVPHRPQTNLTLSGQVSTVKDEISVVEFNNLSGMDDQLINLSVFQQTGVAAGGVNVAVPKLGTRHVIINQAGTQGFLEGGSVGGAVADAMDTQKMSAISVFYRLVEGRLAYAYAAPFLTSPGNRQVSEFNSFLGHLNEHEVHNTSLVDVNASIRILDYNSVELFNEVVPLGPLATSRIIFPLPVDTYGTIVIEGEGLIFRNHVSRGEQYTLPFIGR